MQFTFARVFCCLVCVGAFTFAPSHSQLISQTIDSSTLGGLVVEYVAPKSLAEKAGLQPGDVVLKYGDRPIRSIYMLGAAIDNLVTSPTVMVTFQRGGQVMETHLPSNQDREELTWEVRPVMPREILEMYRAGRKAKAAHQPATVIKLWSDAIRQAEQQGEAQTAAWLCGELSTLYSSLAFDPKHSPFPQQRNANFQEAIRWAKQLWERAQRNNDPVSQALAANGIAGYCLNSTPSILPFAWLQRYHDLALSTGNEMWAADALYLLGMAEHTAALRAFSAGRRPHAQLTRSQDFYRQAFNLHQRLAPRSVEMAQTYFGMGKVARDWAGVGEFSHLDSAYDSLSKALDLFQTLAPESAWGADCLRELALVEMSRYDLPAARRHFEQALAIGSKKFASQLLPRVGITVRLALVTAMQGAIRKTAEYVSQTQLLSGSASIASNRIVVQDINHELRFAQALAATAEGDLASAENHYRTSLTLPGSPQSKRRIPVLVSLGTVEAARGKWNAARTHIEEALVFLKWAPPSEYTANAWNALASVYTAQGDTKRAKQLYQTAYDYWQKEQPNSSGALASLYGLASLALLQGDLTTARHLDKQALTMAPKAAGTLMIPKCQTQLGQIWLRQGKPAEAQRCFEQAITLLEAQRGEVISLENRVTLMQQNFEAYVGLRRAYLAQGLKDEAFAALERTQARALTDSLARRRIDLIRRLPARLRETQLTLDSQRRVAESKQQAADKRSDAAQKEAARKTLEEIAVRHRQWESDLALALPRLNAIEYPQPLDRAGAQRTLPPGTLALCYAVDEKETTLFTLTDRSFHVSRLPIGRAALKQKVMLARSVLTSVNKYANDYEPVLRDLYAAVLAPVREEIKRARSLVICPDDSLRLIPFHALMPAKGRFLIEAKPVHVVGSLTLYHNLRKAKRTPRSQVVAFGDPIYTLGASPSQTSRTVMNVPLERLSKTGDVARALGALYAPHSRTLLGKQATIAKLQEAKGTLEILHLGCHGKADDRDPLSSWLALTPDARNRDGLLYTWQIMQMQLDARLVVLWACETGLGGESQFEGIQGVARAFQTAGADSVLMTLWEVREEASAQMLQEFYTDLKTHRMKRCVMALRDAQIAALKRDPRPYLWASFVLNGAGE